MADDQSTSFKLSRRNFLSTVGVGAAAVPLVARTGAAQDTATVVRAPDPRDKINFAFKVNGREQPPRVRLRTTLLDALREHSASPAPRRAATTASAAPAPC